MIGATLGANAVQDGGALERVEAWIDALPERPVEARLALETIAAELRADGLENGRVAPELAQAWMQACVALGESALDADEREACFEEARFASETTGNPEDPAWVSWRCALALEQAGLFGRARALVDEALARPDEIPVSLPWLLVERSVLDRIRGAWNEALRGLEAAEAALANGPGNASLTRLAHAVVAGERAQLHIDLGLPDVARGWLEREERLARECGDPVLLGAHTIHTLNCAIAFGDPAEVERLVARAQAADASGDVTLDAKARAMLLVRRGVAQSESSADSPAGRRAARAALDQALREPALQEWERHEAELVLADLDLSDGNALEAERRLAPARARLATWIERDELHSPAARARLSALESRLARVRGAGAAEQRARLDELRTDYDGLLAEWASTPQRAGGVGFLRWRVLRAVLGELVGATVLCEPGDAGRRRAVEDVARAHALGTLARSFCAEAPRFEAIRELLVPAGGALLLFVLAPRESHLFWIDAREVEHALLSGDEHILALHQEWLASLQQEEASRSDSALRLRDALLPETIALRLRSVERVSVCGLEGFVPFALEALPTPADAEHATLGLALELDHLPSLALGVHLAREATLREDEIPRRLGLLVADRPSDEARRSHPEVGELPWTAAQSDTLLAAYGPGSWVRSGVQARIAELDSPDLEPPGVLHIVAHGVLAASRERSAGLALAPPSDSPAEDGVLWCERVEALDAPALVVLASCGAARGPLRPGEDGVQHLGGAFLGAGAQAVVLASGDLDLAASTALFEAFHRALAQGQSPAGALRTARRSIAEHAPWRDPLHHGLVFAFGLGQRPLFSPNQPRPWRSWPWIASATLLATMAFLFFPRGRSSRATRRPTLLVR